VGADTPDAPATPSAEAAASTPDSPKKNTARTGRRVADDRRRIEVRLTAEVACAG